MLSLLKLTRAGTVIKKEHNGTYVVFFYIWSRIRLNYRVTIKSGNTAVKEKLFTKPTKTRRLLNFYFKKTSFVTLL